MTAEHLLDAMGLLDDELIREAERYAVPKRRRNYGNWVAWAASFAVVLVLGYGLTHFGIGSGGGSNGAGTQAGDSAGGGSEAMSGGSVFPAASEPAAPDEPNGTDPDASPGTPPPGEGVQFNSAYEIFGIVGDWAPAIMVDGALYWDAAWVSVIRPEEDDIRYSTSYIEGIPEEDGQTNFHPEGVRYLVLEDGNVGVNWNGSDEWHIFHAEPPPEP